MSIFVNKALLLVMGAAFLFCAAGYGAAQADGQAPEIHFVKAEGVINPIMAEYLTKSVRNAEAGKAAALVIQLDTPGGLDLSMREIIKTMLSSEVPVVVYVAPSGSRAASAGVFITYAANVAAMAPGTNIGSAHPVAIGAGGGGGGDKDKPDETMMKKVENDAVAYIKGIALKRGRNAEWAERAVRESVNITAEEAVKLKVIDFIASDREELLKRLDGRKVELVTGKRVISTVGATVVEVEMNLRARILSAISNPNVAYILMMIGLIGLYFELSNPGAILPGVIGAVCLVLAFYAFQTLSINYAGLLLIGLAIVFFIVEISVVSYGLLTIAGLVSLILGSLMLFESPAPFMKLSVWVMMPTVVLMTAVILGAMYYAVKLHKRRPVSGAEGLIGEIGTAVDEIDAGRNGTVFVDGEYWDAVADGTVAKGGKVRVVEVTGLTLKVTRV